MKNKKPAEHYLDLPYAIALKKDESGDIVARLPELPGCVAHGVDEAEAIRNLKSMQRLWVEDCIAEGQPVPEPEPVEALPSGKWLQRVPRTLHKNLIAAARFEGVSLNQFVTLLLSEALTVRELGEATHGHWHEFPTSSGWKERPSGNNSTVDGGTR